MLPEKALSLSSHRMPEIQAVNPAAIQAEIWSLLRQEESEGAFFYKILQLLTAIINARGSVILARQEEEGFFFQYDVWNDDISKEKEKLLREMSGLAPLTVKKGTAQFVAFSTSQNRLWYLILTPPFRSERFYLGTVLELGPSDTIEPFLIIAQLMAGHLGLYALQKCSQENQRYAQESAAVVELFLEASQKNDLKGSITAIVHRLQKHLGCYEVALGFMKGKKALLQALSQGEHLDRRTPIARAFQEAMEETAREKKPIYYPQPLSSKTVQIDLAQQKLVDISRCEEAFSIPLIVSENKVSLVWTFLWKKERPSDPASRNFILAVSEPLGWFVEKLRRNGEGIFTPFFRTQRKIVERLRYLLFLAGAVVMVWFLFLPMNHIIHASCELRPSVRRVVAVPFDGILLEILCKSGDSVKKDQILARLDGKEMRLELASLEAEWMKARKEMDTALADQKIAQYQMARLKAEKYGLRIRLLEERLRNLEIRAPIDGVILAGDLERVQGVTVSTGQPLFDLAPLNQILVEIGVEADEISYIQPEVTGEMMLESYPGQVFPLQISHLNPVSEMKDSRNVFICHAVLDNPEQKLRPGIKGKVRLIAGKKPLWWIWFHRPLEWLRLQLWW